MMSLTELMDAAKGVSNMYMAHEIAIDKVSGTKSYPIGVY